MTDIDPTAAPKAAKKRRHPGRWLVVIVVVIVVIVIANSGGKSKPATHAQKVASFHSFVASIKNGLGTCNAGAQNTQVALGLAIEAGKSVTASDMSQLAQVANEAQGPCDDVDDNTLLNMENEGVPGDLPDQSAIQYEPTEAGEWAEDCGKVLALVQKLANGNDSVSSQLQSEIQAADQQRSEMNSELGQVASSLGVKFSGLGLAQWGSG